VAYMRRHAALIQCTINSFVLSALAYAIVQLAPAIARHQLHVGKTGYGMLVASYGVGSIICGVLLAGHADRFPRSRTTLVGMVGAIAGALMLAAATHYVVGVAALFVIVGGFSRIYSGAHWPTDVLGGILIAVAWLSFVMSIRWISDPVLEQASRGAAEKAVRPAA